jgi:hypothetical protein
VSVESISRVLNADLDCNPTQRLVLIGIANHDGDGGAWPSIATLARYAGVSGRSVQYALAELEKKGYIERLIKKGGTENTPKELRPNRYIILWDEVKPASPGDTGFTGVVKEASPPPVKEASPEPSLEPSDEPSTPHSPPTGEVEVLPEWESFFEQFWKFYPRKIAKPAARRAMKKAWTNSPPENIAEGTRRWVAFWDYTGTEHQFIPHPATFLNQERYNDPLPEPSTVKAKMSKAEEAIAKIRNRDA